MSPGGVVAYAASNSARTSRTGFSVTTALYTHGPAALVRKRPRLCASRGRSPVVFAEQSREHERRVDQIRTRSGPITRTVADAALFLDATAIRPPPEPFIAAAQRHPEPLRIALAWNSLAKYPLRAAH